jgi:hypothetical protein
MKIGQSLGIERRIGRRRKVSNKQKQQQNNMDWSE